MVYRHCHRHPFNVFRFLRSPNLLHLSFLLGRRGLIEWYLSFGGPVAPVLEALTCEKAANYLDAPLACTDTQ